MRILQIIHKIQNRGAETFACQLSQHLMNLGHEVKIVALYNGKAELPFDQGIIVLDNSYSQQFFNPKGWKRLSQIISEFQPDVIQANSGDTLKYSVLSKIIYGWKSPLIFRNASEVGRYLKSPVQKFLNNFLYKNVDWVISVSKASKNDILTHFPYLKDKVNVIGVGLESDNVEKVEILKPLNTKHIIHVGGFTFEKNHRGLLKIFNLVLKDCENVHLHLIGDGPLKNEIEKLTDEMGLGEKITFYGFVNNPLAFIKSGNVLVLPSIIEGLPGVILEAMICRTHVVAFDVGGISEILNNRTGQIIAPNNYEKFANAICDVLKHPNNLQLESAYNFASNNFMNSRLALKFVNSYEKLVLISR